MNEAWAAVVAAIAAGVFGIIAGIYVGRRQTTDQAAVEHGQWLRDQRQETYLKFVQTWEDAVAEFSQFEDPSESWFWPPPGGDPEPYYVRFDEAASRPVNRIRRLLDQLTILGPTSMEDAAAALLKILTDMRDVLWAGFDEGNGPDWSAYRRIQERKEFQRALFVKRAREVMQSAPRPGE